MNSETISSFFIGYFLINPVFWILFFAFGLLKKKMSISLRLVIHKYIILGLVIIPLLYTYTQSSADITTKSDDLRTQKPDCVHLNCDSRSTNTVSLVKPNHYSSESTGSQLKSLMLSTETIFSVFIDLPILLSISGFLFFMIRLIVQQRCLFRLGSQCKLEKEIKSISILSGSLIQMPFSAGWFRKKVFLPMWLKPEEKEMIIEHEMNHFRKHHNYWTLFESFIAYIFWYNPFSHFIRKEGVILRENECDSDSVKNRDKFKYSRTLLKSAEMVLKKKSLGLITHNWVEKKILTQRLENIMKPKLKDKKVKLLLVFCSFTFIILSSFYVIINIGGLTIDATWANKVKIENQALIKSGKGVDISKLPPHVVDLLIVQEDQRFYQHNGIDVVRMMIAAFENTFSNGRLLGASTLTQQLARLFLYEINNSKPGKLEELRTAKKLEKHFSKNEIIELHLNKYYYGANAYGFGAAADIFFSKKAELLSLEEAALILQSITSPSHYNLKSDPERAHARKDKLLKRYFKIKDTKLQYTFQPNIKPMDGFISSRFGKRKDPFSKEVKMHSGTDIVNKIGSPIFAPAEGVVVATQIDKKFGKFLVIKHLHGFITRYGQLESFEVKVGQSVKRGDLIAKMGNSGISSGPHLHYEIRHNNKFINPEKTW